MSKKPLEIDMAAGSQLRDTQGEMLSVEGADISELIAGRGRLNDNHGKGFFNSIGAVTGAKKIFKEEDCEDDRQRYYWDKIKAPYIYVKGYLYDDEEHPNAKAAAAIMRNIHKSDMPLKMKASVEGGVVSRGVKDSNLLARTKIHSVALTFTPANQATLVEPLSLEKNMDTWEADQILIKSVMHLAKTNVPSFRHVTRHAQAEKIVENFRKINELAKANGLTPIPEQTADKWIEDALSEKISTNIHRINKLVKALTAGYGGAGAPTNMTGGSAAELSKASKNVKANTQNLSDDVITERFKLLSNKFGLNPQHTKDIDQDAYKKGMYLPSRASGPSYGPAPEDPDRKFDLSHELAHWMLVPHGKDIHNYLTDEMVDRKKVTAEESELHEMATYHLANKLSRMAGVSPNAREVSDRRSYMSDEQPGFPGASTFKQVQYNKSKTNLTPEQEIRWNKAKDLAEQTHQHFMSGEKTFKDGKVHFQPKNEQVKLNKALPNKIVSNLQKINSIVKQLSTDSKKKTEILEKASKKQIKQMTGNPEVADWVSKHLDRDDLALWFARAYKANPKIFNDENKTKLEHYGSVKDQHKELQNLRLGKEHNFEAGMNALRDANSAAEERHKQSDHLIEPDENTKKLMDAGNGYAWYSLGKGSCDKEAAAMGHCGNKPSEEGGDDILSLRKEKKLGDKIYHEPHLTFINNDGYLGEMKGKANEKPKEKYHGAIKKLLESDHVKAVVGGGYEPNRNFQLTDLPREQVKELIDKKPGINPFHSLKKIDSLPPKFDREVEEHNDNVADINKAFRTHGDLDSIMKNGRFFEKVAVASHPAFDDHITKDHIDSLIKDRQANVKDHESLLRHNGHKVDNDSLHYLIDTLRTDGFKHDNYNHLDEETQFDSDVYDSLHHGIINNNSFDSDHADNIMVSSHAAPDLTNLYIRSNKFKKEHMDKALNSDLKFIRAAAIQSKHFGPEHMEQALNDKDKYVKRSAVQSKHFGPEHMDKVLNDEDWSVRGSAISSEHFKPEHMEQALNDKNEHVRSVAVNSKHFKPEHMEQALNDESEHVKRSAVQSKHFGPEYMEQALNDESPFVRHTAVQSKHFGPEYIERALNDKDWYVRKKVVESPAFGPEHVEQALNDESESVKGKVVESPVFGPEHMEQALNHKDKYVRHAAVESPHFGPEHMEQALNDQDWLVKRSAVQSKHFGPEHMEQALNDKSQFVRHAAVESKHFKPEIHNKLLSEDEQVKLNKALTAGYGGAGAPTNMTGGSVMQAESLDMGRGFKYFTCPQCGKEQIYASHQVKCRGEDCGKNLSLEQLYDIMVRKK